tara:strand:- start:75 stop:281 length:207 start_codon:yes stop_codon:yes gene_type:complete
MKTIKLTYTEVIVVTNEVEMTVTEAQYKQLQNEDSKFYQDTMRDINLDTVPYDSHTDVESRQMDLELV